MDNYEIIIFKNDNELNIETTCAESANVQIKGNRRVSRRIKLYDLDMIIFKGVII